MYGNLINVFVDVDKIVKLFLRNMNESDDIIFLKLKRSVNYKSYIVFEYIVRLEKIIEVVKWLIYNICSRLF